MKKLLLIVTLITVGILIVYSLNRPAGTASTSGSLDASASPIGKGFDFALEDLSGKTIRLSDYEGKPVVVVFFATWCPPCKMEIPHLKKLHADRVVDILAVNVQEAGTKVSRFVRENGISYSVLLDERGVVSNKYSVNSIPTTLLINPDGSIQKKITGFDPAIEKVVTSWVEKVKA